jgi:hypothetical protein
MQAPAYASQMVRRLYSDPTLPWFSSWLCFGRKWIARTVSDVRIQQELSWTDDLCALFVVDQQRKLKGMAAPKLTRVGWSHIELQRSGRQ